MSEAVARRLRHYLGGMIAGDRAEGGFQRALLAVFERHELSESAGFYCCAICGPLGYTKGEPCHEVRAMAEASIRAMVTVVDSESEDVVAEEAAGSLPALTPVQEKILSYIRWATAQRGYAPSVREIGQAVNLRSTSTVVAQLRNLENKGRIRRLGGSPRAMGLLAEAA